MLALIGQKKIQGQRFLENGRRIPVTLIDVKGNCVIAHKTSDRDHYQALQLGFSMKKKATRAELGHAKGAKLEKAPKFLREVRIFDDSPLPEIGAVINPAEVFQPGDIIDVSGISKGKGFAGGVKRHGFHGGPKTHGQSDRHRAPGSIGQGTTPGRVYKGKRMAGRMGNENVTIQNLKVIDVTNDGVLVIKGLVPGIINSLIMIQKVGTDKNFVPLWKSAEDTEAASRSSISDDAQGSLDENGNQESASLNESQSTDSSESLSKDVGSTLDSSENGQAPTVQDGSSTEVEKEEAASVASDATSGEPKEVVEDGK